MTTYTGNGTVTGGYYLNVREWKLEAVDSKGGTLPGGEDTRYVRVPLMAMLLVAPLLGLVFVVLLPFLGLAVVIEELWQKAVATVVARRVAHAAAEAQPEPTTVRR